MSETRLGQQVSSCEFESSAEKDMICATGLAQSNGESVRNGIGKTSVKIPEIQIVMSLLYTSFSI